MSDINFNRIDKNAKHYSRARNVFVGKITTENKNGTLYLNHNESVKNEALYSKLTPTQIEECKSFVKEYNQDRRLIENFSNESFNAQNIFSDNTTIKVLDKLLEIGAVNPINTIVSEAFKKEILNATNTSAEAKDICRQYSYDYTQLETHKKHKNVFTATFENRKSIIELFLSLEEDKKNILNNLNDYLSANFNTDKQFSLEQIYRMVDPQADYFPKSYMLGAMLDIIERYGVNPTDRLDIDVVFFYWYQIRLLQLNEFKAIQKFIKEFELDESTFELDKIQQPLVELMTREVTDKYVGLGL
jgi:hypothetical protein